jgi:hypothetical protein
MTSYWNSPNHSYGHTIRPQYPRQLRFSYYCQAKVSAASYLGKLDLQHPMDLVLGYHCHSFLGHLWNVYHSIQSKHLDLEVISLRET